MSAFRKRAVGIFLAMALVGSFLLLSCQPTQPVPLGTPKSAEKAVATPAKPAETPAAATKPAAQAAEKPVRGGTLGVTSTSADDTLDTHATTTLYNCWLVYEALFRQDQDLHITKEGLAKDWAASPDGKNMTLKLQEGVKFHDGTDFDAAAVKFNIERIKDPATKSPYRSDYDSVKSVEVVDGLTVRLNLSVPDPILLSKMSGKGGQMVSPAAVKKYGVDFSRNGVGTGPFRVLEWAPGDHLTLRRFEGYWRKDKDGVQLPYLDGMVIRIAPDVTVAFANLRTGQANLFLSMTEEQLPTLKSDPNFTTSLRTFTSISGIYLNTKRPPFDNKALRQAVALVYDRAGIAARLGEGAVAHASVLHPMTWAYDEKVGQFPGRDLAKAKAKMAEAGYPSGGLKMKMPSTGAAQALLVAQMTQANLAEIGLDLEIEVLGGAAHTTRVRMEQNYLITSAGSMGLGLADPGYILGLSFHSQGTRNYYGPYGNPQVDQLLDKALTIYDQKERTALYREAAKIIAEDAPFIPTYMTVQINGISKKLRNFVQYADNYLRLDEVWLAQ